MTTKSSSQTSALPVHTIEGLVTRIKAEYIEVPDLQLTPWQAQRLWGLEPVQCDAILGALVDAAFLRRTRNGSYIRVGQSL
jgi:hypothetical protein